MNARAEELMLSVFGSLPRQGPGSLACTRRALARCEPLPPDAKIIDLGCGVGAQTLHLASLTSGSILAIDRHPPSIARLRAAIAERGLSHRVHARVADFGALDLPPLSFDLVWSEGALYNLGLDHALPLCAGLLRSKGYLAFTDAVWRTIDPPAEVRAAFAQEYPSMRRVDEVLALIERGPWRRVDHFDLPDEAWWDAFYGPLEQRLAQLRSAYVGDEELLTAVDELAREPEMHRRLGHHYGYTFFIAQRRE
ncbi:MAG: class I SAM-dependent methyltransferase [Myxococcales bacterium FL481]|nr:MAG: class I SAM-dependent methyltransferase [Myxococcales bacterium FL481]